MSKILAFVFSGACYVEDAVFGGLILKELIEDLKDSATYLWRMPE